MKRSTLSLKLLILAAILFVSVPDAIAQFQTQPSIFKDIEPDSLMARIEKLPSVKDVKRLASKDFKDKYVLYIEQPVSHKDPSLGKFRQRVFVMHAGLDRPTVLVTEGYGASYAGNPNYREEISRLFNTNIIFVEHRYFLESTPENKDWKYLTAENSAFDLHNVTMIFREVYKKKWIATGISKGGQTALLYRAFFPDDVHITVPYVAPLCKGVEDGRHEPFIANFAGTPDQRAKILAFQREVLKRRATLQPMFDSFCNEKRYEFNLPLEEIYDYSVLEFSFALWQWGSNTDEIPALDADDKMIFAYWMKISSPDYFVKESPTTSFFIQAAKELGYYGYDTKPFEGLLKIKSSKGYLAKLFLPQDQKFKFSKKLSKKLEKFVATTTSKMIFIYGEYDPWSAVMVNEPKSSNIVVVTDPAGSHRARISTLPEESRQRVVSLLERWLLE
ncbi:MAG: aminopeptidase [Bacteroidales bacterium]|mgnify:FL=1|nr:aminopeptidase [Bacteroidales bacterium]MBP8676935.1 aminopeptidase [Bacteroidales bacterium]MBP9584197.1 aminopeptidase [Bacteroidales bacterium]MBP9978432.1 aminopeptidase [Bacteroidales bacterium]